MPISTITRRNQLRAIWPARYYALTMIESQTDPEVETESFEMRSIKVLNQSDAAELQILVCLPLEQAGFINAFSTRLGGVSALSSNALNLAYFRGDGDAAVDENRRRFLKAIGAEGMKIVTARQTHSVDRVIIESQEQAHGPQPECDATLSRLENVLLGVQTADCLPILIGDTKNGVIAAIHAGWRGTAGRIAERTIADMMLTMGANPRDCFAAIGPTACADCYEVGDDVIERYKKEFGYWRNLFTTFQDDGKAHLDIRAANIQQLLFCGFDEDRIHVADYCTMHQNDLFFSYRREGKGQPSKVGRLLSVIGRRPALQ